MVVDGARGFRTASAKSRRDAPFLVLLGSLMNMTVHRAYRGHPQYQRDGRGYGPR
jgi:hypothetical protein